MKRGVTRMDTLNSVYGREPTENKPEFSQITEASNENETDPETSRNEAYKSVISIKFDS